LGILPKGVIKQIEAICRNFLWGQKAEFTKVPPVAWSTICKPKKAGGLGVHQCDLWNLAAVAKHLWCDAQDKLCLWVKWAHGIYIKDRTIWTASAGTTCSWYWRKLLKVREKFAAGYTGNSWTGSPTGQYSISLFWL